MQQQTHSSRPRILIIYTGGTIGMIEDPQTHTLSPFDFNHLIDNVPKIKMLDYDIEHIQFDPPIDSSNVSPEHWKLIASEIGRNYKKFDGFVVLHGTDHRITAPDRRSAHRRRRKPDNGATDRGSDRSSKRRTDGAGSCHTV